MRRVRALDVEAQISTVGDGDGVVKGGEVLPSYGESIVGSEAGSVVRPAITGEGSDVVRSVERAHLREEAAGFGNALLTVRNIRDGEVVQSMLSRTPYQIQIRWRSIPSNLNNVFSPENVITSSRFRKLLLKRKESIDPARL